eukprot:1554950-Heterocapsa_arctica.AAC.1
MRIPFDVRACRDSRGGHEPDTTEKVSVPSRPAVPASKVTLRRDSRIYPSPKRNFLTLGGDSESPTVLAQTFQVFQHPCRADHTA